MNSEGRWYEGPIADGRADLAAALRGSTTHTAFDTTDASEIHAELAVTDAGGTSPTLDVILETKTPNADWYTVAAFPQASPAIATITHATTTGGVAAVAEVQTLTVNATGGDFDVTFSGQTAADLAYNISAANLQTALEALSNIAPGDVVVTGGPGDDGGTTPYTLTWSAARGAVAEPTTNAAGLTGGAGTAAVATTTPGVTAVAEVQTITIAGADGGTFTLTYSGQTTAAIAYGASGPVVQAALEALSNIAPGDVTVTKLADVYTLTFGGALTGNVAQLTSSATSLSETDLTVVGRVFTGLGDECRWKSTVGGSGTPQVNYAISADMRR